MNPAPGILRDERRDEQLRRDGFTIVPVISSDDARALLDRFHEIRGNQGEGFEADLTNSDVEYRRVAAAAMEQHLGNPVASLFVDRQPFLWNFLCKWPDDPEDLYLHRDWMFVDESSDERSFSIWIALQNVGPTNGMLRVLPGSHRLNQTLAGTGLDTEWLAHEDVIEQRLLDVPVRAGDGVVIDHALVHGSYRNRSAEPRVAVGCGLRAATQQLVHFRRSGPDTADRYEVDDSFFIHNTPQSLIAAPPDRVAVAEVRTLPLDLDADQLAHRLDELTSTRISATRWYRKHRHQRHINRSTDESIR